MKAIVYTRYGPPDVLQLKEVERPAIGDDQVLVEVQAVSLNAMEWHLMEGKPMLARFMIGGFRAPKSQILGSDIAGRVEAVGKNVTQLKPGDEVFGGVGSGGFAQYVSVAEKRLLLKPSVTSFEAAAAVPVAAITALQALRDNGHIQPGQKVLINGASGGVGTFAVQLAKSFGAEVTGVCSTRNMEMVRGLGADHVIDYTKDDFTRNGRHYDLIVDIAANHSVSEMKRALSPNGICVGVGFSNTLNLLTSSLLGLWASKTGSKKFVRFTARVKREDLALLKELLEEGKIVPELDRRYPLSKTAEAMRYFIEEHARGKVVITVSTGDE